MNETLTFYKSAIKIADGNASTDIEQVVLRATRGNLRLGSTTGITFVSGANNSVSMTISGTLTSLNACLNGLKFAPTTDFYGSGTISIKYTDAMNGLSVSTKIAVTIGTTHASFGPPIQTASPQSTGVAPASQSNSSTVGGTVTSPDLSGTLAADDFSALGQVYGSNGTAEPLVRSPANSALNVQTVESFSANGAFACQSIADSRLLKSRDASEHALASD